MEASGPALMCERVREEDIRSDSASSSFVRCVSVSSSGSASHVKGEGIEELICYE